MRRPCFVVVIAVLVLALSPAQAQQTRPEAKALFDRAIQTVGAGSFKAAVDLLRQAHQTDPSIWALPDSGALDRAISGLKSQAARTPADAGVGKNLAWIYFMKGMQKEALTEYRRIVSIAGKDPEVEANIRTLESWAAAAPAPGTAASSPPGSGESPAAGASASPAAGAAETESIKDAIKKKDEEIAALQKEKEELQKKIEDLEKEEKDLQLYKTQYLIKGGGTAPKPHYGGGACGCGKNCGCRGPTCGP